MITSSGPIPYVSVGYVAPSKRHPGRKATRQAAEARGRWLAYHSPWIRANARKELAKALEEPKEVKGTPERAEQDSRIAALQGRASFTPYVRPEPKIKHQRGAMKRLLMQIAKAKQPVQLPEHIKVDYIPPPVPETVEGAITGPAQ